MLRTRGEDFRGVSGYLGEREQGTGNREQGTGNREQGTGGRGNGELEEGTGNGEWRVGYQLCILVVNITVARCLFSVFLWKKTKNYFGFWSERLKYKH